MPILNRDKTNDVKRYNEFVRQSPYAAATQDLNWSLVKSGWGDVQIYVEEKGEIQGAVSILTKSVLGYKMLYATKGPVCDVYDEDIMDKLMAEVDAYAKANKAFVFRMDPERLMAPKLQSLYESKGYKVRNVKADKDDLIQPRFNMVLGLEGFDEESLLKNFSKKTRYNINLSRRKDVEIYYENSEEALDIFFNLSEIMSKRQHIFSRSKAYFKNILEAFEGHSRIYIAKHEDDYLAAAIAIYYGDKLWYIYGASSNEKRNLMPNYLMQWEMIRWGLELKAKWYDFGGVFELNNSDGLYKFKEGFCRKDGVTELIGEIDKIYKPLVYYGVTELYPKLKKIRSKLKR